MSEYITIEPEYDDSDLNLVTLSTNLPLAMERAEHYANREEGDEGSPLAQTLFGIEGLAALDIDGHTLTVRRDPDVEWPALIDEISAALKDFYL